MPRVGHAPCTPRSCVLLVATLLGFSLACSESTSPPIPSSISLNQETVTLDALGATVMLTAQVRDQDDQPIEESSVDWSSSNSDVASVDADGTVTAVSNGTAQITASSGSAEESTPVTVDQVVTEMQKTGGDAQTGTVGASLPDPLGIQALDRLGNPAVDRTVSFSVVDGNGAVDPTSVSTDTDGRASTIWTLGTTAGAEHRVDASASEATASFSATAVAAEPDSVEKAQGDGQVGATGFPLPDSIIVHVLDEFDNPVPDEWVVFRPVAGSGSVSPDSIETDADGRAATEWTVGPDEGEDTLKVETGGIDPVTFTAQVAMAGEAANIEMNDGEGQTGLVGFAVNIPPSVLITDAIGNPVPNQEVTFAVTAGGGSVTDATAQTGVDGIATVGSWTLGGSPGSNALEATASIGSVSFTADGVNAAYQIDLRFLSSFSASRQQVFLDAAARWEELIYGDLSDITVTPSDVPAGSCGEDSPAMDETIDDLVIFATLDSIDGPAGIVGQAAPCFIRNSNALTLIGRMTFDTADVADLESDGLFDEVILHEMGHVLGLGALWQHPDIDLLRGAGGADPHFIGVRAIEAFDRLGGSTYTAREKVPVENDGGAGTRDKHWEEDVLDAELMTGFLNGGEANPLSELTVASFWDMGYQVNLDGSDSFTIAIALRADAGPGTFRLVDDIADLPIYVVGASGRIVKVIPPR